MAGSIFPRFRGAPTEPFFFCFQVLEKARGVVGISHAITLAIKSACKYVGEYRWEWRGSKQQQQQRKCAVVLW